MNFNKLTYALRILDHEEVFIMFNFLPGPWNLELEQTLAVTLSNLCI